MTLEQGSAHWQRGQLEVCGPEQLSQGRLNDRSKGAASGVDLSVIVPTFNEEVELPGLLRVLREAQLRFTGTSEIIIADGGSTDRTLVDLPQADAVRIVSSVKSRALQLNAGAALARGRVLYFVHADARPPLNCLQQVAHAVSAGAVLGGYRFSFDSPRALLALNSYFTRFNLTSVRGGDQTIFVRRQAFEAVGGYCEDMCIMEEYELIRALQERGIAYTLLSGDTLVSDRKYLGRSWLRVQYANFVAMRMWYARRPAEEIRVAYAKNLGSSK